MNKAGHLDILDYAVSLVSIPGETESGDLFVVKENSVGVLIGVVDGLGHGSEAAEAARIAVQTMNENADESIISITRYCHEKLKSTRGVVMSLASINKSEGTIAWLGVGNVTGILLRSNLNTTPVYESIVMRAGVVGYNLPPLYASVVTIFKGDILIFSTDGIKEDYIPRIISDAGNASEQMRQANENALRVNMGNIPEHRTTGGSHSHIHLHTNEPSLFRKGKIDLTPEGLANYICNNFKKGSDDALVTVAKFDGE